MRYVVKSVNDRTLHLADAPYTRSYCPRLRGALVVVDSGRASEWIADRTVTVCTPCRTALQDRRAAALAMDDNFMIMETEGPRRPRPAAEPTLFETEPTLFDATDGPLPVVGVEAVIAAGVPATGGGLFDTSAAEALPVADAQAVIDAGVPVIHGGMLPVVDAGVPVIDAGVSVTASAPDRSNSAPDRSNSAPDRSNALLGRSLTGPAGDVRGSFDLSGACQEMGGSASAAGMPMVGGCCSCGESIERPLNAPRPACTHEGTAYPDGSVVAGGYRVTPTGRGRCFTDRHDVDAVALFQARNTVARCGECVAADLGIDLSALPAVPVVDVVAAGTGADPAEELHPGDTPEDGVVEAEEEAETADIVIRHTHEDGTTVEGSAKGDGVWEALRPLGWAYRRTPGIFIRGSRYKGADRWKIDRAADAVRTLGLSCAVVIDEGMSFAEREAARVGAAEDRAERFADRAGRAATASQSARDTSDQIGERFWMGQPILVGHHSEGRARRDQERMHNAMRKSIAEGEKAGYWASRAAAADAYERYRNNPGRTLRRIEKLEAERRGVLRERDGVDDKGRFADVWRRKPSEARREELTRRLAEYDEELTYWAETIKEAERRGFKVWGKPDFVRGDFARCGGTWYEVTRVNAKTVTVPHILAEFDGGTVGTVGGCRVVTRAATDGTRHKGSTYTLPYNELGGRMSAEQMQAALAGEEIPADPRDVTPEPAPETGEAERAVEHHGQTGPAAAADVTTEADPADVWADEGGTVPGVPAPAATVAEAEADHQVGVEAVIAAGVPAIDGGLFDTADAEALPVADAQAVINAGVPVIDGGMLPVVDAQAEESPGPRSVPAGPVWVMVPDFQTDRQGRPDMGIYGTTLDESGVNVGIVGKKGRTAHFIMEGAKAFCGKSVRFVNAVSRDVAITSGVTVCGVCRTAQRVQWEAYHAARVAALAAWESAVAEVPRVVGPGALTAGADVRALTIRQPWDAEALPVVDAQAAIDAGAPVIEAGVPVTASTSDRSNVLLDRSLTGQAGAARGSSELSGARQEMSASPTTSAASDTAPRRALAGERMANGDARSAGTVGASAAGAEETAPADTRALTIRQPWADAIVHGVGAETAPKRIENRTRPVPGKYVGATILIHAGLTADRQAVLPGSIPPGHDARGAIIGTARIVGGHPDAGCCRPWGQGQAFHWELADVRPISAPVPAKGALGFWRPDAETLAAVRVQLDADTSVPAVDVEELPAVDSQTANTGAGSSQQSCGATWRKMTRSWGTATEHGYPACGAPATTVRRVKAAHHDYDIAVYACAGHTRGGAAPVSPGREATPSHTRPAGGTETRPAPAAEATLARPVLPGAPVAVSEPGPADLTLFDVAVAPAAEPLPARNQRIVFTGGGQHWHGTVTRTLTGHDGQPRVGIDVDPAAGAPTAVVYRLGSHFRLTRKGETCPGCGKPDRGLPPYSRP